MNPANPNNAQGQQQQQQQQRPSLINMILIFFAFNYVFSNFFGGNNQKSGGGAPSSMYVNVFNDNEPLEFRMYITDKEIISDDAVPVWEEKGVEYNYNKENFREKTIEFNIEELLSKGNDPKLYAHFVLVSLRDPTSINFTDFSPYLMQVATINLVDWRKKDANLDQDNLLFSEKGEKSEKNTSSNENSNTNISSEKTLASPISNTSLSNAPDSSKLPHLRSKVWIQLVHDTSPYLQNQLPLEMRPKFVTTEGGNKIYVPIMDTSQFWARKKDFALIDMESENKTISVTFMFNTYWSWKYMMETSLQKSDTMYADFGMGDNMEEIKEMVLEANPILFVVTVVVGCLHSLFEFLALKNEVQFWRNLESHKGLSLRGLWMSLITEVIVLLYLMDNETSFLILVSSFAGLGVTVWKILKTTKFKKKETFPFVHLDYQDAYKSTTMEYDQVANKYLSWLLVPLLAGYTVYSLVYEKHKGWYSFVLQTLVGFIYVFGFIQMTPQLYINYKLKSVEHLPWRVMIYKFLNTIVDDLFAFVITMPWLKRLSCFRDDVIFIIYLYQRWIYRVDKNRDPYGNIVKKDEPTGTQADNTQKPLPVAESTAQETQGESTITHRKVEDGKKESEQKDKPNVKSESKKKK